MDVARIEPEHMHGEMSRPKPFSMLRCQSRCGRRRPRVAFPALLLRPPVRVVVLVAVNATAVAATYWQAVIILRRRVPRLFRRTRGSARRPLTVCRRGIASCSGGAARRPREWESRFKRSARGVRCVRIYCRQCSGGE